MIHTITGLMNSGKTLFMVYKLLEDYKKRREIITNFGVNFTHSEVNKDYIIHLAETQPHLDNISFGFDEIWVWMGSRSAMSKESIKASTFFLQSSKGDVNIYITTQDNSQNDKRIRQNQHFVTTCERVLLINGKYKRVQTEQRILPLQYQEKLYISFKTYGFKLIGGEKVSYLKEKGYLKAKPLFNLFDTHQKIK